ncbi:SGNH/GDSL hydrolase family protein [Arenicella xantha]|uniref:GDSL-like lipase/acylhydrolase family protein n=1 Tax=Arenicella xantha TaxID=644221 RepID=A0A395JMP1_9GAMM|nr:SGNH/GDSL hydrolase family protein [Arenicella xantha]RBP52737.1 GDSL-like lipase/acylhydrolase family protein [Arenicella xantha]
MNQRLKLNLILLLSVLSLTTSQAEQPPANTADSATDSASSTITPELAPKTTAELAAAPHSIVVLGDSVAAGEGINYGYRYDNTSLLGARWIGGTDAPIWQPPYPLCHDSAQAYGNVIANDLGANLAKFACTGATYQNGLVGQREYNGKIYRPAEFGTPSQLNPDYKQAAPDTVIITFGADDVNFVDIVTFCATGYTLADAEEVERIFNSVDVSATIKAKFTEKYPDQATYVKHKQAKLDTGSLFSSYCTAKNPGKPIQEYFWKLVNNGTLRKHYLDMVSAIQTAGKQAGKVPNIIFTTYHNPLPTASESIDCHDLLDLDRAEVDYLNTLEATLDRVIKDTLTGIPGVQVADISQVMDGHRWCSDDPWTYGLSVLWLNRDSQAPFHPTPAGQRAIADIVKGFIK